LLRTAERSGLLCKGTRQMCRTTHCTGGAGRGGRRHTRIAPRLHHLLKLFNGLCVCLVTFVQSCSQLLRVQNSSVGSGSCALVQSCCLWFFPPVRTLNPFVHPACCALSSPVCFVSFFPPPVLAAACRFCAAQTGPTIIQTRTNTVHNDKRVM
jgi:hypothetical protein